MLSRIKNNIYRLWHNYYNKIIHKKTESIYSPINITMIENIIDVETVDNKTTTLFRTKLHDINDHEIQQLFEITTGTSNKLSDLVLEDAFETELSKCENTQSSLLSYEIFKTKMRLLYVIIANNLYNGLFDEKKSYASSDTPYRLGVFKYGNYIIRIDDSPHCFLSEKLVFESLQTPQTHIILPFITYINKVNIKNGEVCKCDAAECTCAIRPLNDIKNERVGLLSSLPVNSNIHRGENKPETYSDQLKQMLQTHNISFSIQPFIKDSESLLYWAKENMANNAFIDHYKIKQSFFIHLFYKCACLIETLHDKDIVHGDIKPDNILLEQHDNFNILDYNKCRNFTVYLIDYGLTGINNTGVGTGGTTPYCHPEFRNIRDSKHTDNYKWRTIHKKHDVWSLGLAFITLYLYRQFYSYYYKYPSHFFDSHGYVTQVIIDSIDDDELRQVFSGILTAKSLPIKDVIDRLNKIIEHI